jgi:uncharacterized protein (DUF983 family)
VRPGEGPRLSTAGRPKALTAIRRGLARRCPHCGQGPLFKGFAETLERCPQCGLVYERNPGDTWLFTIVGDRLPVAAAVALVYFGVFLSDRAAGTVALIVLGIAVFATAPNRWGAGIALHYLSRAYFPDPADPIPGGRPDSSNS